LNTNGFLLYTQSELPLSSQSIDMSDLSYYKDTLVGNIRTKFDLIISESYKSEQEDIIKRSGLFMPSLFSTSFFKETGGFPEGNIYSDGNAGSMVGNVVLPGDIYYFNKLEKEYGMQHITVFDSLVYHIQEGEKDE
jgi:hypothetical protein